MTALERRIIEERLGVLEEAIEKLEREQPASAEALKQRDTLSDATLYRMQVGIEAIIDIGGHILTESYNKRPASYRDTIAELGNVGVIPKELAEQNEAMPDFRNLVVHHYTNVDYEKVYEYLKETPEVFRQFAEHFAAFLDSESSSE